MLTVARPQTRPEFENSVICCGKSEPCGFFERSYQPKFFFSPKSLAKPKIPVDSARSAEHASTSGRPIFSREYELNHEPKVRKPFLLAIAVPGATNSSAGSFSGASQEVSSARLTLEVSRKASGRLGTDSPSSASVSARYSTSSESRASTPNTVSNQPRVCSRHADSPGSAVSP